MISNTLPIIALPGFGLHAKILGEITSHLSHPIQFYDLPVITSNHTVQDILDEIHSTLPQRCILLGYSLGGMLAAMLAAQYPDKINQCIIIATSPRFKHAPNWPGLSQDEIDNHLNAAHTDFQQYWNKFIKLACYPNRDIHLRKSFANFHEPRNEWSHYLKLLFTLDARDALQNSTINMLHITGSDDAITPKSQPAINARHTYISIKTGTHALPLTHASEIANLILRFICNI